MLRNLIIVIVAVACYCLTSSFYKKVNSLSYSVSLPDKLDGPLASNDLLDKIERLHENAVFGPESFASFEGRLYTGLEDGRIVQVTDQKIIPIVQTGEKCEGFHEEHICGRPLGLAFNKAGRLFAADCYLGLVAVDIRKGKKEIILPSDTIVEGLPVTLMNSLHFDKKEENLYITQISTRWNLSDAFVGIIEHDVSGRLLKYNLKTKKVSVLLKDLAFPNGVVLTHDGTALLVAETINHKVFKYYIAGPKQGSREEVPLKLPGEPDNLKQSKTGNYWVTVAAGRTMENPTLIDKLSDKPIVRNLILNLYRLITAPVSAVLQVVPHKRAKEIGFELQNGHILGDYIFGNAIVIEFSDNGKILRSFHSPSGKVTHITEAFEHEGYLYLASWRNRYIGRLKL